MTGESITADEAFRIGLANRVYPPKDLLPETLRFAESLASRPPEALFATKRLNREIVEMDTASAMDRMFETVSGGSWWNAWSRKLVRRDIAAFGWTRYPC